MLISGFLIVTNADLATYYFSSLKAKKRLEFTGKVYRGCGRAWDCWLPEHTPKNIKDATNKAQDAYSQNLMYSLFQKRDEAIQVLDWINDNDPEFSYDLLKINNDNNLDSTREEARGFMGIDIDCNGHYPIKEELFAAQIASVLQHKFEDSFNALNENGLFDSFEEAKRFVDCYSNIQEMANIEKILLENISYSYIYQIN